MHGTSLSGWLLAIATTVSAPLLAAPPTDRDDRRFAEAVAAIVRADYRGDRAELARRAESLAALPLRRNVAYREYWTGFAYWRRGMNGYNEAPPPDDLMADFERCAAHERAALARDPGLQDARSALAGCVVGQLFIPAQLTPDGRAALIKEIGDVMKVLKENAEGNPRSLWIVGGSQAFAPPPNGDPARAAETYRRGLAAARAEALSAKPREPWVPVWGAPELLMSLAFLNTVGPRPNQAVARAYAESALAMVPDWHYVRDILLPRIEKLDEPVGAPGGATD